MADEKSIDDLRTEALRSVLTKIPRATHPSSILDLAMAYTVLYTGKLPGQIPPPKS